jgi:hypothetical protein
VTGSCCLSHSRNDEGPHMERFPQNDIISLVGEARRFDPAESCGPHLSFSDLPHDLSGMKLSEIPLG